MIPSFDLQKKKYTIVAKYKHRRLVTMQFCNDGLYIYAALLQAEVNHIVEFCFCRILRRSTTGAQTIKGLIV